MVAKSSMVTPGPKTTCGSMVANRGRASCHAEPDAFGIDQGCALLERFLAPSSLPVELEMGELGMAVDARRLPAVRFDCDRRAPSPAATMTTSGR